MINTLVNYLAIRHSCSEKNNINLYQYAPGFKGKHWFIVCKHWFIVLQTKWDGKLKLLCQSKRSPRLHQLWFNILKFRSKLEHAKQVFDDVILIYLEQLQDLFLISSNQQKSSQSAFTCHCTIVRLDSNKQINSNF